jgi:hypothetical protein
MNGLMTTVLALTLTASAAMAETTAPLAAGKPAGVKAAQNMDNSGWLIAGGVAIAAAGIALAVSGGDNNNTTPPPTTGTTGTTS